VNAVEWKGDVWIMRIATAERMRELDREAIEGEGIASLTLMENAAAALADRAMVYLHKQNVPRAVVFCGTGNNGGDGAAAARLLKEAGVEVRAVLVGDRDNMTGDCRAMEARLAQAGVRLEPFSDADPDFAAWALRAGVFLDALFGIGLRRAVEGDCATAVHMMNSSGIPVISADIPSGVEADTGRILGVAVEAAETVTFTYPKVGHFVGQGQICTGELTVADIGIPEKLTQVLEWDLWSVSPEELELPHRARDAHKGSFGRVCILGGSVGYTGAPVLSAMAAVRSGAGLVSLEVPAPIWPVVAGKLEVAMPRPLPAGKDGALSLDSCEAALNRVNSSDVALIGPGLGRNNSTAAVVRHILAHTERPLVLDADGINALEGHIDVLDARRGFATVLTPHDGEFARLGGDLSSGDRLGVARAFAAEHGCVLVLKGHRTITAFPDGNAYVNTTGNPGMAKGGSGDILAGMIVSLMAQGLTIRQAVPAAVCLHGQAGDLAAEEFGEYSMSPTDLIHKIPLTTKHF